jgi:hypothetical protein
VREEGDEIMTRIPGGRKVMTGRITEGTYNGNENKISLFDGRFDTAYKLISFKIAPETPATSQELIGKLSVQPKSNVTKWNWSDIEEIAWAHWGADKYQDDYENVRDDSMIVEDLYVSGYNETVDGAPINYEIILEKHKITAWDGASIMVRNQSQSGPA